MENFHQYDQNNGDDKGVTFIPKLQVFLTRNLIYDTNKSHKYNQQPFSSLSDSLDITN